MNLSKLAVWLSKITSLLALLFLIACNPYHHVIRNNSPSAAAQEILDILTTSYPFSSHKAVDWEEYKDDFLGFLESDKSDSGYLSLRDLIYNIPDSRLLITSPRDKEIQSHEINGHLGFSLYRFNDESVRVIYIDSTSNAYTKGLRAGNQIIGWDGKTIKETLRNKQIHWGINPASRSLYNILQDHFISFGRLNESIEIFYENAQGNIKGIKVPFEKRSTSMIPKVVDIPNYTSEYPDFQIIEGYGLWTIKEFNHATTQQFYNSTLEEFNKTKGLIIDLRRNTGGHDAIASDLAQYFVEDEFVYEEIIVWDYKSQNYLEMGHTHLEPVENRYSKPVVLILGPLCNGAGEGFARALGAQENVTSLGFWNTAGSFSYPGGQISLPHGIKIHYPIGFSLGAEGSIIIESPGDFGGGIYPDIRIKDTYVNLASISNGKDILLEEALYQISRK